MRLTNLLRTTVSASVVAACAFGFAGAASAQSAPQDAPATIDDIIVTAQKREQNLQDVPIVVTSLSQETLQDAGVRDIKDLQILTPGMTVTSTSSEASTTARIRGVGTVGDNPGLESSVGVVIDGVYRSRNSVGFGDLGELQRIEILKGPQGTLFGKNTSAGVINIMTEAPSFTQGYNAELTMGNYGAQGVSGSVTGPISDNLAFRLYGAQRKRHGFMDIDTGDGPRSETTDGNQDFGTIRGQLLWLPNDNTSIRLIADYSSREEFCCIGTQIRTGPTYPFIDGLSNGPGQRPPAAGFGPLPFSRTGYANRSSAQDIQDKGLSVEANIDLPSMNATLTSVTSWRDWSSTLGHEIDYTGADIVYRNNDGDFGYSVENLTQEFRLAGSNARLDWLIGVFATSETIERGDSWYYGADYTPFLSFLLSARLNAANPALPISPATIGCYTRAGQTAAGFGGCLATGGMTPTGPTAATGPGFTVGQGFEDFYEQDSTSFAIFTNNSWHVTDAFDITLGLRYTHDNKSVDGRQVNVNGNGGTCAAALANAGAIGAVLGAATPTILGNFCLPWSNAAYNNRVVSESFDDGELSGTIKAAYRLNDSVMTYVSYARGYKSFGYNLDRVQTGITPNASLLFPSEVVDSYEAGVKMTLLDRTLLLNATYYDQTFENFQLNTFLGTAFVVESIPELTSRGVDADMVWFTPIQGLSFQGGVTYTDAKYGNFTAADLSSPGNFPQLSLLPGARASFAPEWSATGSINYDRNVGNGLRIGLSLAAKYMDDYNTGSDLLPYKEQLAYTTMNGRFLIGSEDERWTAEFWVQNLTDEEYIQVAYNAPLQGSAFQTTVQPNGTYYNPALDTQTYDAFLGQPRTYGATLRFRY
ncbi:MAG: TonB-dependent receptor [Brevundimonas sp.]|uniref:TonB-dependent receptor n=1 Tax=Brevundimonas sp. TaxID=1871086 RepID=UPI002721915F|nr:TonB-dependent receptor [Brevundimonas sp.]MDO9589103.1 TonB-dependent receptor [Brevundimonas sp.]MDP3657216.1 TonB-dependent receptor [Brevundimonas sp.]MDZ4111297.1 TonB-dependent receptor [Brevundimonas sp.]